LGCDGIDEFITEFKQNPQFDMHKKVAALIFNKAEEDIQKDERTIAKTINLGVSYGMGISKLGQALGLTDEQAKLLKKQYNEGSPFLDQLNNFCKKALQNRGYIKTIAGRLARISPSIMIDGKEKTFEYKALNQLIQGSACDQTTNAMVQCYKENLPVLFPVHDELCISGTLEQAERVKEIMEHAVELVIPSFTDIKSGDNWSECK